ncbi:MAG: phosphoenolpyruvate carboxylase [Rhodanobacteraceae bacterium]
MQPLRAVVFGPTDQGLRDDVGRLGRLVGQLLVEQEGEAFFARVEAARTASIARRERGDSLEPLARTLQGLDAATADAMSRAFATYFQVVNIAERVHRVRRRRDYEIASAAPQPEGLRDVLLKLHAAGVGIEELLGALARLDVEPVFTAHPTESSRRVLLEKEQDIVRALIADLSGPHTPHERAADWARLRMALTTSWQTADISRLQPTVADEVEHVMFYLADPIYRVLPAFEEALTDAIRSVYGVDAEAPRVLRFASWVGGDMDGNPNVGARTIAVTLRMQRKRVLARYRSECQRLARRLSQTLDCVDVAPAVLQRLAEYREMLPDAAATIRPRHANMPYRALLRLIAARLEATGNDSPSGYADVSVFTADIGLIAESLRLHKGMHAGWFAVRRLQRRIAAFGFHLARLDQRQDSRVHSAALVDVLGELPADDGARARMLVPYAGGDMPLPHRSGDPTRKINDAGGGNSPKPTPELLANNGPGQGSAAALQPDAPFTRVIAVFREIARARNRFGDAALGVYVISMAGSVADVLGVLALARAGGLVGEDGNVPLDIAPLFETIADLDQAPHTFAALLGDPTYRAHLGARGNRQTIMLGYSDSAKDGGILAARWTLQRSQVELLAVAREEHVDIVFFHGRGGSIGRGGGKTSRAVMAAPRGAIDAHLRVTEQGEVIHRKYGMRALALRTFEQTVGAVLSATLRPRPPDAREANWREVMTRLAADGEAVYRKLVVESPGFVEYFHAATPIDVIERMTLGSRPPHRGKGGGVTSLRAIPWVFAWTQCRSNLPSWYGVGGAMEKAAERGDENALLEMARDWPFFRTLIEDLEMVLAKSDPDIAERFSQLAGPLHGAYFPILAEEFGRTVHWVLRLRGNRDLLAGDPRLAQSIRLRNPYADPMSLVQVDLLQRWRASGRPDDAIFGALASSVHGVALALQNTG